MSKFDINFWNDLNNSLPDWISEKEARFLVDNLHGNTYVEIGVAYGKSFRLVDKHFKGQIMQGFDIIKHPQHDELSKLRKFLYGAGEPSPTRSPIYNISSREAATTVNDGWVHTLFIDGDHTYQGCLSDFVYWYNKVKVGGRIIFHDYGRPTKEHEGVTKTVDAIKPLLKDHAQEKYIFAGTK